MSFEQRPHFARGEDQPDRTKIRCEQAVPDVSQPDPLVCAHQRNMGFEPRAIHAQHGELAPHREKAQRRKHRQQKRRTEQHRAHSLVERAAPEGEIQAKATMQPARREQRELAALAVGRPERPHDASVVGAKAVKLECETRGRKVADQ